MEPRQPLTKLSPVARRSVRLSSESQASLAPLLSHSSLPLLVRPTSDQVDLLTWTTENRDLIDSRLLEHGGILFRGFKIEDLAYFQRFIEVVGGDLLSYTNRSTPRNEVMGRIYTSTEYPSREDIPMHNENSYSHAWPARVYFYCEKAAEEGGMTPIADSHKVFERIPPEIRDRFMARKVMYVRNYGEGVDLSWQEVFQTENSAEVEEFCRKAGIDWEWRDGGRLHTRQVCQAVARHPVTGKMLWFNQVHLFHVSSLEPDIREALLEVFQEEDLPRNALYGDGTPLELSVLETIRQVYRQEQVKFPWQNGDILMLDNMAVAHGRTAFKGERKVRVGMTGLMQDAGV